MGFDVIPGTCDDMTSCSTPGARYADRSDCEWFYECLDDGSLMRVKCEFGVDTCDNVYPCLFDIYDGVCKTLLESPPCFPRCL